MTQYQQQYPQNPVPNWFTEKHIAGLALMLIGFMGGMFSFLFGFVSLGLAWCFLPFLFVMFIVGIVLLF